MLSIPSAALAVTDLADRIRNGAGTTELIDHAQQLAAQQVTIYLTSQNRTARTPHPDPDQLLDLADEDPAS